MAGATKVRWPIEPLLDQLRGCSESEIGVRLGVDVRHIVRIKKLGWLSTRDADRFALKLGLHPANLWPQFATLELEHQLYTQSTMRTKYGCDCESCRPANHNRKEAS